MNKAMIAALAGTLAFAPAALAGHKNKHHGDHYDDGVEYAKVVSARPIYRTVRVTQPQRECWDERVVYQERAPYWFDNGAAGTIFGAIAGGVAGHQFGKGRGKDAATALGAVIGAGIGQRVVTQHGVPPVEQVGYEERCRTVHSSHVEERVEAYDVTYRFNGRLYHTRMPYDPGERIPVRVDVEPVSY